MLDPEGVINYNGVDSSDFDIKLNSFFFTLIFPVIGLVLVIISKHRINKLLALQARMKPFSTKRRVQICLSEQNHLKIIWASGLLHQLC